MPRMLESPRVLISGSRLWPWDAAVDRALDRLLDRYRERLTVIEGRARGADLAAHRWCVRHRLGPDRHRCYPVDWAAERRRRPSTWRRAGHDRNTRMLLREWPELVVAFHHQLDVRSGGTSNMCLKALLVGLPVWLVTGPDPVDGQWLHLDLFPARRVAESWQDLTEWAVVLHGQPLEELFAARSGIGRGDVASRSASQRATDGIDLPDLP
jgi:YspA, cpYpsA-related SLOG family